LDNLRKGGGKKKNRKKIFCLFVTISYFHVFFVFFSICTEGILLLWFGILTVLFKIQLFFAEG